MAPTPTMNLLFCLVGVALLSAPRAAQAQDECFNGMVCCTDCDEKCEGNTIACKADCISPCIDADICVDVGETIARGAAAAACQDAKSYCEISIINFRAASFASVDLKTCCKVIIGSCQGDAEKIPCTVEDDDYGDCSAQEFQRKYLELVSQDCKDTVCGDNACKDDLANDPKCD